MIGTASMFEGRRNGFEKCIWWSQDYSDASHAKNLSDFIHDREPTGTFWAEELQPMSETMAGNGDIRYRHFSVTIGTYDDIHGLLRENDVIRYRDRLWRVQSIQFSPEWKKSQFVKKNGDGQKILSLVS